MFKKARSRRPLRFESLERRELCSVNVTMSAGSLVIQEVASKAAVNDQVAVFSGGAGNVVVACNTGIANHGGAPWIVLPWVQNAKSNLTITMGAGNDAVSIGDPRLMPAPFSGPGGVFAGVISAMALNLNNPAAGIPPLGLYPTLVQQDVLVKLGLGDDLLVTNFLGVGRDLYVDTQTAARLNTWAAPLSSPFGLGFSLVDEAILGFNTFVGRNATLYTQTGNDLVMLGASSTPNVGYIGLQLCLAVNDPLGIGDAIGMAVGGQLKINTHAGADSVYLNYTAANSLIDVQLDTGPDYCTLWGVTSNTSINVAGSSKEKNALVDAVFGLTDPGLSGNVAPSITTSYALLPKKGIVVGS